ncbi:MAG: hypothetical protein K6C94_01685 [Candidatus Gastranaerophilales bacterium]|nr:hypothetical protein [Candidatus Gastranaerophilales bacterium]
MRNIFKVLFILFVINLINPQAAFAYLDPNTGSMVLQTIIACVTAIGLTFKMWKNSVISFFKKITGKNDDEN